MKKKRTGGVKPFGALAGVDEVVAFSGVDSRSDIRQEKQYESERGENTLLSQ